MNTKLEQQEIKVSLVEITAQNLIFEGSNNQRIIWPIAKIKESLNPKQEITLSLNQILSTAQDNTNFKVEKSSDSSNTDDQRRKLLEQLIN